MAVPDIVLLRQCCVVCCPINPACCLAVWILMIPCDSLHLLLLILETAVVMSLARSTPLRHCQGYIIVCTASAGMMALYICAAYCINGSQAVGSVGFQHGTCTCCKAVSLTLILFYNYRTSCPGLGLGLQLLQLFMPTDAGAYAF